MPYFECWGSAADSADRWRQAIASGSVISQEITRLWAALQLEATHAALLLDTEVAKALVRKVAGIGYSSVTGETRGKVEEARDNT